LTFRRKTLSKATPSAHRREHEASCAPHAHKEKWEQANQNRWWGGLVHTFIIKLSMFQYTTAGSYIELEMQPFPEVVWGSWF
jgi:hypothetical protein